MKSYHHGQHERVRQGKWNISRYNGTHGRTQMSLDVCQRKEENNKGFVVKVHQGAKKWMKQWHEKLPSWTTWVSVAGKMEYLLIQWDSQQNSNVTRCALKRGREWQRFCSKSPSGSQEMDETVTWKVTIMDDIRECGRENGISPDPIGLATKFKCH